MPKPIRIMGSSYNVASRADVLQAIERADADHPVRLATLNPELLLEAQSNRRFREALQGMTHCTIDGSGLYAMLRLSGHTIERYPGATMFHELCERYSAGGRSLYFLGGLKGEARTAAGNWQSLRPKMRIAGSDDGGRIDIDNPLKPDLLRRIEQAGADILFVGFGAPKQELWIRAAAASPVPVMAGIGGSFGFYGLKRRAPAAFQRLGIEWLYRGFAEPHHWRRVWRAVVVFPIQYLLHGSR